MYVRGLLLKGGDRDRGEGEESSFFAVGRQETQLSPSDRAMRLVSTNLANYHATVQKLLLRQVLAKPMV